MPESRSRKKADYTPPTTSKKPMRVGGPRWIAPVMVACWVLGLAWIVTYYIAPDLRYMRDLGDWNLLIGMGLIAMGFVFSTKWE
ncbi:MAG: cell division protein CrgA [Nocardioidaceae bacterium]